MKRFRFIFILSLITTFSEISLMAMKRDQDDQLSHQSKRAKIETKSHDEKIDVDASSDEDEEDLKQALALSLQSPSQVALSSKGQVEEQKEGKVESKSSSSSSSNALIPAAPQIPTQDHVITRLPTVLWHIIILYMLDTLSIEQFEKIWKMIKQMPTIIDCDNAWELVQTRDFKIPLDSPYPIDFENAMVHGAQADVINSYFLPHIQNYNQNCLQEAYLVTHLRKEDKEEKEKENFEKIAAEIAKRLTGIVIDKEIVRTILNKEYGMSFFRWLLDNNRIPTITMLIKKGYIKVPRIFFHFSAQELAHKDFATMLIQENFLSPEMFEDTDRITKEVLFEKFIIFVQEIAKKDYGSHFIVQFIEKNLSDDKTFIDAKLPLIHHLFDTAAYNNLKPVAELLLDTKQSHLIKETIQKAFITAGKRGHTEILKLLLGSSLSKVPLRETFLNAEFVNEAFQSFSNNHKTHIFMLNQNLILPETARKIFLQQVDRYFFLETNLKNLTIIIQHGNNLIDNDTLIKAFAIIQIKNPFHDAEAEKTVKAIEKLLKDELERRGIISTPPSKWKSWFKSWF